MQLKTETKTDNVERQVCEAAEDKFGKDANFETHFEHGQWWVIVETDEDTRTFSVVDACPGVSHGLDFEEC